MSDKPSRNYIYRTGAMGWGDNMDMWYDEEIVTLYEGDTCPECEEGELKVSKKGKLYCSKICWLPEPSIDMYEEDAFRELQRRTEWKQEL